MARTTRGAVARLGGYVRRHHLALIALFLALGGTSYTAVTAGRSQAPAPLASGQTIRGTWSVVVGSGGVGVPGGHTDGVGDGSRYGFEVLINGTSPFVADGIWA